MIHHIPMIMKQNSTINCGSDFRNEINGIFVLGWVFSSEKIRFINLASFNRTFLYHSKAIFFLEPKFEKILRL